MNLWYLLAACFVSFIVGYSYGYGHAFDKWQKAYARLTKGSK